MNISNVFTVDGKPFFPLAGQVHNSSAYTVQGLDVGWKALEALHANTAEIPVYWEQIEPHEGQYDFRFLDVLLDQARQRSLKLILLWFATWKNGTMKNSPAWVKLDSERFRRVRSVDGAALAVLSPHCQATWEADRRAFCALLDHLRQFDNDATVIAMQIENEPGILGSDRDYSSESEELFNKAVPTDLVQALRDHPDTPISAVWRQQGERSDGTWPELFGWQAGEFFSAWHIARFINALAQVGKAIHPLCMFANVWSEQMRWRIPGVNYPSGGATTATFDLWKWATPDLDLIGPDIYIRNANDYKRMCETYARRDNPLFIPESACHESNALNMFYAIAEYNAVGYALFGIEDILAEDGAIRPQFQTVVSSFRSTAAILPLLIASPDTPTIYPVIQEEYMSEQYVDLGIYIGLVVFHQAETEFVWSDFQHYWRDTRDRGRGLLVLVDEREVYAVGTGYRLLLKKKGPPEVMLAASQASEYLANRLTNYVSVEEGHFNADGTWVVDRQRSGDESDFGVWIDTDVGVVRVVVGD